MLRIVRASNSFAVRAASSDGGGTADRPLPPDNVRIRLRLIGQMEGWTATGEGVLPTVRRARALLAMLALASPRPWPRSRLAEVLWAGRGDEQARASLRQELHRLQEALAPVRCEILSVNRDQIAMLPGLVWVDAQEIMLATPDQPAALALMEGNLLEGLAGLNPVFDQWLKTERERLRDHARDVAEQLLLSQPDAEPQQSIHAAQRLIRIDRAHEGAWRALMRAHAVRGERGLAIQAYERCRAVLAEALDAEPSVETLTLLRRIRGVGRDAGPSGAAGPITDDPLIRQGRVHVGVMPFDVIGLPAADHHFGPGLAEEITSALSRFRWLFVVAAQSVGRVAAGARDEFMVRRTLGIDFLVDGTLQRSGNRLRVTVRLVDLRANAQVVWARRFDRQINDISSLQDDIASEVVAQIDPEILMIEARRASVRPDVDPSAYDLMLRAIPLIGQLEREPFMHAGRLLAEAISLEPDYATAHAWYAYWHIFLIGQDWGDDPAATMTEAERLAERATVLDPFDARALSIAGHVRAFLHKDLRGAAALHERALALNPNLAMAWSLSAVTHAYLGDLEEAERRAARYKQLSPLDPHAFFFDAFFVLIHLLRHEHEAAVRIGRAVTELNSSFSASCKPYLAALGHLGLDQEAALVRERLLAIEPDFSVDRFLATTPLTRDSDRAHVALGLRLAGVPGQVDVPDADTGVGQASSSA